MIFRQLFDSVSSSYTYLLASRPGGEALIIDPVLDKVERYLTLLGELDLKLVKALDTHVHADHVTGVVDQDAHVAAFLGQPFHVRAVAEIHRIASNG